MSYLVTAPLVIAKDQAGKLHHMYANSVIPWLNSEQREHFLSLGLVEELDTPEFDEPDTEGGSGDDSAPDTGGSEPGVKPPRSGSEKAWREYAVSQGHDQATVDGLSKQELIELLG